MELQFETEHQSYCPMCGCTKANPGDMLYAFMHLGVQVGYKRCDNCGVLWLVNRMSDDFTDVYYRDWYRQITIPNEANRVRNLEIEQLRAKVQSILISHEVATCKRVLDFGCSTGELLKQIGLIYPKCELYGVEANDGEYPAMMHVYKSLDNVEGEFDLITASHSLEHQNHPLEFLQKLLSHLSADGYLMIDVPNATVDKTAYLVHHPIAFTPQSMEWIGRALNLGIVATKRYNWDYSPIERSMIYLYDWSG